MNEGISILSESDFIGLPVTLVFFYLLLKWLAVKFIKDKKVLHIFYLGIAIRILGLIFATLFHLYVEPTGDSHAYFYYGEIISKYFSNNGMHSFFNLLWGDYNGLSLELKSQLPATFFFKATFTGNKLIILITALISYFTFNSYLAISIVFSLWSYFGLWLIFKKMTQLYPKLLYQFSLMLFWPSSVFFSAGILKDPICIGSIGILFYIGFSKIHSVKDLVLKLIVIIIAGNILYLIKSYLFVTFAIAYILSKAWVFISGIKNLYLKQAVRYLSIGGILSTVAAIGVFWDKFIYSEPMQNIYEYILRTSQGQLSLGNTKYDLGKLELTPIGTLRYLFSSLNVSLFRPFIFELNKGQLILSGAESLFMLVLFLYAIIKFKLRTFARLISHSSLALFCLLFFVFVAIETGAISFNFGALVRYKIPLIPFFWGFFIILIYLQKNQCKQKSC